MGRRLTRWGGPILIGIAIGILHPHLGAARGFFGVGLLCAGIVLLARDEIA